MKRYPFGKFILNVPDDHKIFDIHRSAALYDRAFGFILEAISRKSPDGVIIDIGANVGDTAAFIATHVSNPIVSVEGSEDYALYFRHNQVQLNGQATLVEKFVRTAALEAMKLSYQGGGGTGAVAVADEGSLADDRFVSTEDLLQLAQSDGREVCLVKSDTDGMDGFIISDMLAKGPHVPLFFECDTIAVWPGVENPWPGVFEALDGYAVVVFDNFGLPVMLEESNAARVLRDLSGYVHLQRSVHPVRLHYLDVWAFPQDWRTVFDEVAEILRRDLLKPYRF